ncbi:MAG: hypothetical protein WA322_27290 [Pseudolabrys sp.]
MQNLPTIPIDWANVNWLYVAVLAMFVFFSTMIGTLLSFKRTFYGAVLSALLFAAAFVFWNYYPHGLPLPTLVTTQQAPAKLATPVAPAAPGTSAAVKPANPDTTVNPPASSPPGNSQ